MRKGIGVVLVERHVDLALTVSDRAIVLNHGKVVPTGRGDDLLADRDLLNEAYFDAAAARTTAGQDR